VPTDDRVNSAHSGSGDSATESVEARPRWWLRNPTIGVLSAAVLGIVTALLAASIRAPESTPGSTLLYLVILPIALLLPTIALAGMLVAWRAFKASRGRYRLMLAVPASFALAMNALAVGLFMRWVVQVLAG
jgi:hypothetical protein